MKFSKLKDSAKRLKFMCHQLADYKTGNHSPSMPPILPRGTDPEDSQYNLVSSLLDNGLHAPAIDIDIPCRYVPSSTEGHGHLYFDDVRLEWPAYVDLLQALVNAGIVDEAYLAHSKTRGMTLLRPDHVKKVNAADRQPVTTFVRVSPNRIGVPASGHIFNNALIATDVVA